MKKKYAYKVLQQNEGEPDADFVARVNEVANDGYRYLEETIADGGKGRVIMEKEWEEITELEMEKAIGEMKNHNYEIS